MAASVSSAQANGNPVPIDRAALEVISRGDQAIEHRMLTVFRKANDADAAALKQALDRHDIISVTRMSHRVMGAGRLAGALALADICGKIAVAGRAGDWDTITASRNALDCELDRVNACLDTLLMAARSKIIKPGP